METIAQILILVFAAVAVILSWDASIIADNNTQQANDLTKEVLQLQNTTSNFQPVFIPYSIAASVRDVYSNSTLDAFGQFDDYGSLNVSLVVIRHTHLS